MPYNTLDIHHHFAFFKFYFQKTPVVGIMTAAGSVVFAASDGYDAEMWDDTALIREYDRALESSR